MKEPKNQDPHGHHHGSYAKFFSMIVTSMIAMFLLMYLNSYQILDHAWFSETRFFMTLIMGGAMIVIMLAFMRCMYGNRKANMAIFGGGPHVAKSMIWEKLPTRTRCSDEFGASHSHIGTLCITFRLTNR